MVAPDTISTVRFGVVEDDAGYRHSLITALASFPDLECVATWADAETALANLKSAPPEVLFVDMMLPGLNGVELIRRIHQSHPQILSIALTVVDKAEFVFQALEAGAVGYLLKTAGAQEIHRAIREVQRGGSAMTGTIARQVIQTFRRRTPDPSAVESLSPREAQILALLAEGRIYKEIAGALGISPDTVRAHIRNIYKKLQVNSRTEAVQKSGLLPGWLRRL